MADTQTDIQFTCGGVRPQTDILQLNGSNTHRVIGVAPLSIERQVASQVHKFTRLIQGIFAGTFLFLTPPDETVAVFRPGTIFHDSPVGNTVSLIHRFTEAAIVRKIIDDIGVDDTKMQVEDGVEIMNKGVAVGHREGIVIQLVDSIVCAYCVITLNGIKHLAQRMDAEDGALTVVEGVCGVATHTTAARSEIVHRIKAITIATPTPVEMVTGVEVGSVEDEGVSARFIGPVVVYRATVGQILVDHRQPDAVTDKGGVDHIIHCLRNSVDNTDAIAPFITVALHVVNSRAIVLEVSGEGFFGTRRGPGSTGRIGSTAAGGTGTVHHVDSHTAVVTEHTECMSLLLTGRHEYFKRHKLPHVGGMFEVSRQFAIGISATHALVRKAMTACTAPRMIPTLHNLGHGGSHTAHHSTVVKDRVVGTEPVVGVTLVPLRIA